MAKKKAVKTNALRLLDRDHVSYRVEEYDYDESQIMVWSLLQIDFVEKNKKKYDLININ